MHNDEDIYFHNGDSLKDIAETMYLGNELNNKADIKLELQHRKQEVRKTWFKLNAYWKARDTSKKWQIIIFDAIVRSKLTYGLETVQLTDAMKKELDAFQLRGIRQILNKTHTYWNRDHTNKYILELASKTAYPKKTS